MSDDGREQVGMGVGIGNDNLDGQLHPFKTCFTDDMSGLYRNDWKGNFGNVTLQAKTCVETR